MFAIFIIYGVAISFYMCQCFIRVFMAQPIGTFLFKGKSIIGLFLQLLVGNFQNFLKENLKNILEIFVLKILMHTHLKV